MCKRIKRISSLRSFIKKWNRNLKNKRKTIWLWCNLNLECLNNSIHEIHKRFYSIKIKRKVQILWNIHINTSKEGRKCLKKLLFSKSHCSKAIFETFDYELFLKMCLFLFHCKQQRHKFEISDLSNITKNASYFLH